MTSEHPNIDSMEARKDRTKGLGKSALHTLTKHPFKTTQRQFRDNSVSIQSCADTCTGEKPEGANQSETTHKRLMLLGSQTPTKHTETT